MTEKLTIKKDNDKIMLQMYPVQYHKEIWVVSSEFTSDYEDESTEEAIGAPNLIYADTRQVVQHTRMKY